MGNKVKNGVEKVEMVSQEYFMMPASKIMP